MLLESQITIGGLRTACVFVDPNTIEVRRHPTGWHELGGARFDVSARFVRDGRGWVVESSQFTWSSPQPDPVGVSALQQTLCDVVGRWAGRQQRVLRSKLEQELAECRMSTQSFAEQLDKAQRLIPQAEQARVERDVVEDEIRQLEGRLRQLVVRRAELQVAAGAARTAEHARQGLHASQARAERVAEQLDRLDRPARTLPVSGPAVEVLEAGIGLTQLD